MEQTDRPILELKNISKHFPGVQALDDVSLSLCPSEVHAVVGENGAGKSTLMKILSGVYSADQGEIIFNGAPVTIHSPRSALNLGIATIYQEFNLVPVLSVAENIYLGQEEGGLLPGVINRNALFDKAQEVLDRLEVGLDVRALVENLSVADQQIVEIAKALAANSSVLIMDEPTAALSDREVESLFRVIRNLREHGTGILYVSHRLEEISLIADRITVLRDGHLIATRPVSEVNTAEIVRMMIGRPMDQQYPTEEHTPGEPLLELKGLTREGTFWDVDLTLYRGEIVGIAGLIGAGRTELARAIFGATPATGGTVLINGEQVKVRHPRHAIRRGVALVPEDRKLQGLVLSRPVKDNIVLASLKRLFKSPMVRSGVVNSIADEYIKQLDIATPSLNQETLFLSGGNQQKVVLAKWLLSESEVVIFDEPTRGIDVGAKVEIYRLMNSLAREGKAVLMISSELPEILGMSDRVLAMRDGRIVAEFPRSEATEDKVMAVATGVMEL
jgi:ribose transport system ATP-binding protein